jgi:hypothetical protein
MPVIKEKWPPNAVSKALGPHGLKLLDEAVKLIKALEEELKKADKELADHRAACKMGINLAGFSKLTKERDEWRECAIGIRCTTCKETDRAAFTVCSNPWHQMGRK